VPAGLDYLHITTNNTIYGTELRQDPDVPCPLVADMSSDIFSRPVDVAKYDLIYAGAQKNMGPAGVTLVIVKESALGHVDRAIPTMLDYRTLRSKWWRQVCPLGGNCLIYLCIFTKMVLICSFIVYNYTDYGVGRL